MNRTRHILRLGLLAAGLALSCHACGASDASDGTAETTSDGLALDVSVAAPGPVLGDNTVTVEVTDTAGAPVTGAEISVTAFMPAHGHGSPHPPTISELGEGRYEASPVTLHMPGTWTLTVEATEGERSARQILTWEIDG